MLGPTVMAVDCSTATSTVSTSWALSNGTLFWVRHFLLCLEVEQSTSFFFFLDWRTDIQLCVWPVWLSGGGIVRDAFGRSEGSCDSGLLDG